MSQPTDAEVAGCTGCQPGTSALGHVLASTTPGATFTDADCYSRRPVRGGSNWSYHAGGRAIDLMGTVDALAPTAQKLVSLHVQLDIEEVIHNRQIWTLARGWHPYSGEDDHTSHIHISQGQRGAAMPAEQVAQVWGTGAGGLSAIQGWSGGNPVGGIIGAADAVKALGDLAGHLSDPAFWRRVGMGAAGIAIGGAGIAVIVWDADPVDLVGKVLSTPKGT